MRNFREFLIIQALIILFVLATMDSIIRGRLDNVKKDLDDISWNRTLTFQMLEDMDRKIDYMYGIDYQCKE